MFNEVIAEEELLDGRQEYLDNANNLREKHRELKETYNNLKERVVEARTRRQFVEPKVQRLWTVAQESNFSDQELAALKEELFHFESRLLKLSHLHAEHAVSNEKQKVTSVLPQSIDRMSQIIKLTNFCIFAGEERYQLQRAGQRVGTEHQETHTQSGEIARGSRTSNL